jgi:hypothetical protein
LQVVDRKTARLVQQPTGLLNKSIKREDFAGEAQALFLIFFVKYSTFVPIKAAGIVLTDSPSLGKKV